MRLVIDTNVWISALVYGGVPRQVFEVLVSRGLMLITSEEMLSETRRILQVKFPSFLVDFEDLIIVLTPRIVQVGLGKVTISVCRDPDDNQVLETAVIGQADAIISGDNDLLSLKEFQNMPILKPQQILSQLK